MDIETVTPRTVVLGDTLELPHKGKTAMGLILLIIIVVLLMGGLPRWNHSRDWGYGPSGGLGLVLVIVLVLMFMGHIPRGF